MEWVWLLHRYAKVTETPAATVLAGTLYDFVLEYGYDTRTGGLYDELTTRGEVQCSHRRLWPQTEALKAHVARLEHTSDDLAQARITDGIGNLFKYHLIGVPGSWREHIRQGGENFYGCYPSSSLYHLAFAVGELERIGNVD
jgi:N-acyl-D-glucosamine 2-epimerase